MMRLLRTVEPTIWCLADELGQTRKSRLLDVPRPDELLSSAMLQAEEASRQGRVRLSWQQSCEQRGFFRLVAQVPVEEETFDQFFNGRSGYRAQYYISPEEGILYNRDILDCLARILRTAYDADPLKEVEFDSIEKSLQAPHAKIWVFDEKKAFDEAAPEMLNPPRWVGNSAITGRKVPLPSHRTLDVKGAFIRPSTGDLFVDDLKLDRAWDLFNQGFS